MTWSNHGARRRPGRGQRDRQRTAPLITGQVDLRAQHSAGPAQRMDYDDIGRRSSLVRASSRRSSGGPGTFMRRPCSLPVVVRGRPWRTGASRSILQHTAFGGAAQLSPFHQHVEVCGCLSDREHLVEHVEVLEPASPPRPADAVRGREDGTAHRVKRLGQAVFVVVQQHSPAPACTLSVTGPCAGNKRMAGTPSRTRSESM